MKNRTTLAIFAILLFTTSASANFSFNDSAGNDKEVLSTVAVTLKLKTVERIAPHWEMLVEKIQQLPYVTNVSADQSTLSITITGNETLNERINALKGLAKENGYAVDSID